MRIDPVHALALARLDLGDVLRSRWLVFCLLLYAALERCSVRTPTQWHWVTFTSIRAGITVLLAKTSCK